MYIHILNIIYYVDAHFTGPQKQFQWSYQLLEVKRPKNNLYQLISHLYPLIHSWQPLHRPTEPFFWGIQTFQRWSVQPWDHPNLSIEHVQHGWYFKFDASRYHVGSLLQGMMNQLLRIHPFFSLSMGILHCQVSFVEYTYIIIWYVYETYLYIYRLWSINVFCCTGYSMATCTSYKH